MQTLELTPDLLRPTALSWYSRVICRHVKSKTMATGTLRGGACSPVPLNASSIVLLNVCPLEATRTK